MTSGSQKAQQKGKEIVPVGSERGPDRLVLGVSLSRVWERLGRKARLGDGCWEWIGYRTPLGYGLTSFGKKGEKTLTRFTHRLAFELLRGGLQGDMDLDHLCCNPACLNPDHLEQVPHAENQRRYGLRMTHCRRGHERRPENVVTMKQGGRLRYKCRLCIQLKQRERRAA